MIIHSTTLSTLSQVQAIYGANTTWIQHSGYMLRGATSGVVANSAAKTGGADSHSHQFNLYGDPWTYKLNTTGVHAIDASSTDGAYYSTRTTTTSSNIPNYKSVYIWERTA